MSDVPQDFIDQFQGDLIARLQTNPYFADIVIIQERAGTTETEVAESLGATRATGGYKPGIVIIVFLPDRVPTGAQTTLQWDLEAFLRIIEFPKINRVTGGCNKWASTVSLQVEDLLHNWGIGSATVRCVKATGYNDGKGGVGFTHHVTVKFGIALDARCKAPAISGTSAAITITSSEGGGSIFYTVDGTLPTAASGMAYNAPFTAEVGAQIRAVVSGNDKNDSNITEFNVTL